MLNRSPLKVMRPFAVARVQMRPLLKIDSGEL